MSASCGLDLAATQKNVRVNPTNIVRQIRLGVGATASAGCRWLRHSFSQRNTNPSSHCRTSRTVARFRKAIENSAVIARNPLFFFLKTPKKVSDLSDLSPLRAKVVQRLTKSWLYEISSFQRISQNCSMQNGVTRARIGSEWFYFRQRRILMSDLHRSSSGFSSISRSVSGSRSGSRLVSSSSSGSGSSSAVSSTRSSMFDANSKDELIGFIKMMDGQYFQLKYLFKQQHEEMSLRIEKLENQSQIGQENLAASNQSLVKHISTLQKEKRELEAELENREQWLQLPKVVRYGEGRNNE